MRHDSLESARGFLTDETTIRKREKKKKKKKGIERFKSGNRFVLRRNKEINDLGNLLNKLGSNLICASNDSWGGAF